MRETESVKATRTCWSVRSPEGGPLCVGWCPDCRVRLHCETYLQDFWLEIEKDGGPWWALSQVEAVERRILLPMPEKPKKRTRQFRLKDTFYSCET